MVIITFKQGMPYRYTITIKNPFLYVILRNHITTTAKICFSIVFWVEEVIENHNFIILLDMY